MIFEVGGPPSHEWRDEPGRLVELAQAAEACGIDRFGLSDTKSYGISYDCLTLMTACAMSTQRLVIESMVTDPFVAHPAMTARAVATMAELSGGRIVLGLGGGVEHAPMWGEDKSKPLTALREAVALIRGLWRGETVTMAGEVVRADKLRLNFPVRHRIPVLIASRSPRSLRLAGEIADIVLLGSRFLGRQHYLANLAHVRKGLENAGRTLDDVEVDLTVQVCVSDDEERALESAKSWAAIALLWTAGIDKFAKQNYKRWEVPSDLNVPRATIEKVAEWDFWSRGKLRKDLPDDIAALLTREIVDQFTVAGTPKQVADRFRELMTYPGLGGIRVRMVPVQADSVPDGYLATTRGVGEALRSLRPVVDSMLAGVSPGH